MDQHGTRRVVVVVAAALALALPLLPGGGAARPAGAAPAASPAASPTATPTPGDTASPAPPAHVIAVGGPVTMHDQALADIAARTGTTPARLGGVDRWATAAALSRHVAPDGADTAYIASGRDVADALAASSLYARTGSPLLLVDPSALPGAAAEELVRLAPRRVVLLGGPSAISEAVAAHIAEVTGTTPERIAGSDRVATAAAAARAAAAAGPVRTAYLAGAGAWADALAATAAVDASDGVLLLTDPLQLPAATADVLADLAPDRLIALGGEAAIAPEVLAEAADAAGTAAERIGGADRYATAAAITAHARPGGTPVVYAATGLDWADALAAGPAVAAGASLLLVDTTVRWQPDLAAAVAAAEASTGTTSIAAIGTDGVLVGADEARTVAGASTLKVLYMLTYLRQPDVRDRDLTDGDRALLEPMITRSANAEATAIVDRVGPAALAAVAAAAGMQDYAHTRPWGNSRTSARDQATLMWRLPDLLPLRHRDYAMDLLTRIVPEQRWGIGRQELPGWSVHFKGGWGSGTGSVDHQVVRLQRREGTAVAFAVMTTGHPSHADGIATLDAVIAALVADLP